MPLFINTALFSNAGKLHELLPWMTFISFNNSVSCFYEQLYTHTALLHGSVIPSEFMEGERKKGGKNEYNSLGHNPKYNNKAIG